MSATLARFVAPPLPEQAHKILARLTRAQDRVWVASFEFYMGNVRRDATRADRYAWRQLCATFPKLAKYDGATAGKVGAS